MAKPTQIHDPMRVHGVFDRPQHRERQMEGARRLFTKAAGSMLISSYALRDEM
jgi:hypothetical protein